MTQQGAANFTVSAGLTLAILTVVAVLAGFCTRASGAEACMTQAQARALYPTKHLYWHTRARCWDDSPAMGARWHPKPAIDPNANAARLAGQPARPKAPAPAAKVIEPPLTVRATALSEDLLRPAVVTHWPGVITDWDGLARHAAGNGAAQYSADEIDEIQYRQQAEAKLATCCWPPKPADELTWQDRWRAVPVAWLRP